MLPLVQRIRLLVIAFSGRLIDPELLVDEVKSKPPVLLLHGDQDEVVPQNPYQKRPLDLKKRGLKRFSPM